MQQFIRMTFLLLMATAACFAQQPKYKTVAAVLQDAENLKGQNVYVYGIVKGATKDGFSKKTYLVELDGGLRIRQTIKYPPKPSGAGKKLGSSEPDLAWYEKAWQPGTEIVVVGVLKKETGWVLEKAKIQTYCALLHTREQ